MPDIFLTKSEKENVKKWIYLIDDKSLLSKLFNPFWDYIVNFIPANVSPNILSITGFLCVLYSFHLSYNYITIYPNLISLISMLLIFIYTNLDSIDGKHARKTRNESPLGEILDHGCDSISVIFLVLTFCYSLGITDTHIQWYFVQIAELIFLLTHFTAFENKIIKFGLVGGPLDFLMLYQIIVLAKLFGYNPLIDFLDENLLSKVYYVVFLGLLFKISTVKNHYETRNGLIISLLARFIPSIFIYYGLLTSHISTYTIISHGLIMSILTGDIILSKIAIRELHPLVPVFVMISLFDNLLCVCMSILYYLIVMSEISFHLRIPIFAVNYNVYCSGVFDICHLGHMNLFKNASTYGTKLIVGVHSDKDVESYKRKPAYDEGLRYSTVSKCKYVDEVIPHAPLYLTKEFIKEHNIHVVLCSDEYDKPDDKYYAAPRELGILKVLPRTKDISTTEILDTIKKTQ